MKKTPLDDLGEKWEKNIRNFYGLISLRPMMSTASVDLLIYTNVIVLIET